MGLTREDFTRAVLAYQRDMYRAARAMLPCDADAEDAVSQAVLLAWQSRDRLREEDAARAWLVKITVNCARQQCRHRGRVLYLSELEPLAGGREDPRPHELWDAVLSLPPEQRTAVVLFYYEDLSLREIARTLGEELGWNVNTTYTLIKRCMKKGAIERSEPGFLCHALIPKSAVQEAETDELINKVYDGSADKLFAAQQIEKLRQIVGDLE